MESNQTYEVCWIQGLSPQGFHRMAYYQRLSRTSSRMVVCVHGLTRTGRDFDPLAEALLGEGWSSVCPDVVGRGRSDWLVEPSNYSMMQYLSDMVALLARLNHSEVDWIGTSMGGILGMLLAAQPGTPIRRLVLNDIGPFIPAQALGGIAEYLGHVGPWPDMVSVERHLRQVHAGFGFLSDDQWRHLAEVSTRQGSDGQYYLHYDPSIAEPFGQETGQDIDLWDQWAHITCPTLVLRGAESSLLTPDTLDRMQTTGPNATSMNIPQCGHAPSLMQAEQIQPVLDWLRD